MFAIVILILDLALILAIRRYVESTRELARAAATQRMIEDEIESYNDIVAQVEKTARLRHDLRNQLQVTYSLHSRGEADLAKQHYRSMSQMLSDANSASSHKSTTLANVGDNTPSPTEAVAAPSAALRNSALSAPWLPWAPIVLQAVFSAYTIVAYARLEAPPASKLLFGLLLAAGMAAAVWLKRSLEVSTELEINRYLSAMLEAQVEAQRERATILASQQEEADAIRQRIAGELETLAADLENPSESNEDAFDRAFASVKLLDIDKRLSQNPVVDALVAAKVRQYEDAGVELVAELNVPREITLPSTVLCAAFANMLDNALAAAQQVIESGNSAIVEVKAHVKGGFLIIATSNPTLANIASPPDSSKRSPADAPISKHGWGLGILKSLAERYDGDFTFKTQDGKATSTLVMNLQEQK